MCPSFGAYGTTPTPDLLKFSRKNFPREIDLRNRMPIRRTLRQSDGICLMQQLLYSLNQ